jgi:uncharacterized protein
MNSPEREFEMRTSRIVASFIVVALGLASCFAQQTDEAKKDALTAAGKGFVQLLAQGEYAKGVALFDSTMTAAMPEEKLKAAWEAVTGQAGPLKNMPTVKIQKYQVYDIVMVTCQCERKTFDTRVVFDANGKIAGLFFAEAPAEYKPPSYVDRKSFIEKEVTVGSGEWSLHGTLSVPAGDGPFPAIVLVHGSGPNDRDESIGPNKTFRDLAWGLASKGIVVLRYEKRTREHASKLSALRSSLTVKEETIDDALAAVSLLRQTKNVEQKRIYVLGHSLGGMLVPRIGKLDAGIAGFVVLAGATRHLEDVMLEQITYIAGLKGSLTEADKKRLEEIQKQVEKVKQLTESDAGSSESILGAPPSYWLDLKSYDPPAVARTLDHPLFVLQGERDYQVTMTDFERWKSALSGKKNVEFKTYPKLNHLFLEGEGKSTPSEYDKAGHVPVYVIDDIARWIIK